MSEEEKHNPVADEQSLARLLEAAYVLQEHNRDVQQRTLDLELKRDQLEAEDQAASMPPPSPAQTQATEPPSKADYSLTLAQIVETQHQIQVRHLELEKALSLVAERVTQIARAGGSGICVLNGNQVRYRAAAGSMTLPAGTELPMDKALCLACLRTGQVFRCADVDPEFLLDTQECRRRGIRALIAVPIFHNGEVAGGLELYFPTTQAFTDQDVHTCQLMAGLVTEALAREEEVTWKKSLASERAVMLEALEKLQPNLAALVDRPAVKEPPARNATSATVDSATTFVCRSCGHQLVGEEQFCGNCGTPRSRDSDGPSMQNRVASLLRMQKTGKKLSFDSAHGVPDESQTKVDHALSEKSAVDSIEDRLPELFAAADLLSDDTSESTHLTPVPGSNNFEHDFEHDKNFEHSDSSDLEDESHMENGLKIISEGEIQEPPTTALAKQDQPAAWSSAATARDFLEQLAMAERPGTLSRFWNTRRGDIYLAIAVILVACVIRWGIWSDHSVSATGTTAPAASHRKSAPGSDLPLFERMLIKFGLAEAPAAPEYKGNPEAQVWEDLHTALYYCPGTDLYGKTQKGKFTSQRDAQLDQFQPASRKPCD